LQFIQTQNGPYVLELCRRPPGDLYPYFVEASTGYPYIRNIIRGYLGLEIEEHANDTGRTKTIFRHVVLGNKNGIYKGLLISDQLKTSSNKLYEFKKIGENINDFLTETIAVYVFEVSNQERLKIVTEIQSLIRPIID
jgi:hypothetical protein